MTKAEEVAFNTEPPDIAVFKQRRAVAAFQFHLFAEEAWAELYLRDHYPEWLERRLVALLRMREGNRARSGSLLASIPQPLHACWLIYELLRVDLVMGLESDQQRLAQLEAMKRAWSSDLFQLCPADSVEFALSTFSSALPRPLEAQAISETRFDQYCDAVLTIAPL